MIVVADSTPLIALSRVNRLDLLKDVFGKVCWLMPTHSRSKSAAGAFGSRIRSLIY